MEILSDLGFIPSEVIQAVYQHHERSMGTGFPNRLPDNRIIPLAKIVGAVDEFVNILMPIGGERLPVPTALERLGAFHGSGLSKDVVKALALAFPPS
jgi:HD-GYP domain-containing protein (c-di-GMP phosphodiesterase class II)